jgi:NAD(P)-dependent dehydrogenase (short-subunit alcohol dehydrogenase family)
MTERRFDGRVAVITGSGRGLGFEYARLLASLGAKIVINDNGSALDGSGADTSVAQQAADQIKAEGGEAVACTESVATAEGGKAIIGAALDTWGRIDVLIHNAGNTRFDSLDEITHEAFRALVDVHMMGAFNVVRPAFPLMKAAGYGRVVLTGSIGGIYTMPQTVHYAMSKASMIGLNNAISVEGNDFGVKSNVILPGAVTRMAEGIDTSQFPPMDPALVAPMVGYLAHEDCAVSAEIYAAVAGRMARVYVTETHGVWHKDWSIDSVAESMDAIRDPSNNLTFHPAEGGFGAHLGISFGMVGS